MKLLFSQLVTGRNNPRKTFLDEPVGLGDHRVRLFANRCPRSMNSQPESGEQDTGGTDEL